MRASLPLLVTLVLLCLCLSVRPAAAAVLPLPDDPADDIVGEVDTTTVSGTQTLLDIARRHGLGYTEITAANPGVDPWVPGEGRRVVLPTRFILPPGPRSGLVINLAQMRLFHYTHDHAGAPVVVTHPIGVGVEYGSTPLGSTRIVRKTADPTWYPPRSVRERRAAAGIVLPPSVPPGPDNPLGSHALYLGFAEYLIHGTNRPWGIGMRVSSGCIRMYPEGIADLFPRVPVGTSVRIINQPFLVGLAGGMPFVQVFPLPRHEDDADAGWTSLDHTELVRALLQRAPRATIDWERVMRAADQRLGVPVPVGATPARVMPAPVRSDRDMR